LNCQFHSVGMVQMKTLGFRWSSKNIELDVARSFCQAWIPSVCFGFPSMPWLLRQVWTCSVLGLFDYKMLRRGRDNMPKSDNTLLLYVFTCNSKSPSCLIVWVCPVVSVGYGLGAIDFFTKCRSRAKPELISLHKMIRVLKEQVISLTFLVR
jgi:hypothetical protein